MAESREVLFRIKASLDPSFRKSFQDAADFAKKSQKAADESVKRSRTTQRQASGEINRELEYDLRQKLKQIDLSRRAEERAAKESAARARVTARQVIQSRAEMATFSNRLDQRRDMQRKRSEDDRLRLTRSIVTQQAREKSTQEKQQAKELADRNRRTIDILRQQDREAGRAERAETQRVRQRDTAYRRLQGHLLRATDSAFSLARGFALWGVAGEESSAKILEGLVKVEAAFAALRGGTMLVSSLARASREAAVIAGAGRGVGRAGLAAGIGATAAGGLGLRGMLGAGGGSAMGLLANPYVAAGVGTAALVGGLAYTRYNPEPARSTIEWAAGLYQRSPEARFRGDKPTWLSRTSAWMYRNLTPQGQIGRWFGRGYTAQDFERMADRESFAPLGIEALRIPLGGERLRGQDMIFKDRLAAANRQQLAGEGLFGMQRGAMSARSVQELLSARMPGLSASALFSLAPHTRGAMQLAAQIPTLQRQEAVARSALMARQTEYNALAQNVRPGDVQGTERLRAAGGLVDAAAKDFQSARSRAVEALQSLSMATAEWADKNRTFAQRFAAMSPGEQRREGAALERTLGRSGSRRDVQRMMQSGLWEYLDRDLQDFYTNRYTADRRPLDFLESRRRRDEGAVAQTRKLAEEAAARQVVFDMKLDNPVKVSLTTNLDREIQALKDQFIPILKAYIAERDSRIAEELQRLSNENQNTNKRNTL